MEDLQKILTGMSKPEVPPLRHQEALTDLIIHCKRKATLSLWWLSVPVFIIGALVMKQLYKPRSTLWASIRELKGRHSTQSLILLFFLPLIVSILQIWQLRRLHFVRQSLWAGRTFAIWLYWLILFISLIIQIIYLCN